MSSRHLIATAPRALACALVAIVLLVDSPLVRAQQLTASWTDNSGGQAAFALERRLSSDAAFAPLATVASGVTGYVDGAITQGLTYCYRVKAYSQFGESAYSNEACGSTPSDYTITILETGTGTGMVTSTPAGINCGTTCSAGYPAGTLVTLTATPASGSRFAGWSGGGCSGTSTCTVVGNGAVAVTATFSVVATAAASTSTSTTSTVPAVLTTQTASPTTTAATTSAVATTTRSSTSSPTTTATTSGTLATSGTTTASGTTASGTTTRSASAGTTTPAAVSGSATGPLSMPLVSQAPSAAQNISTPASAQSAVTASLPSSNAVPRTTAKQPTQPVQPRSVASSDWSTTETVMPAPAPVSPPPKVPSPGPRRAAASIGALRPETQSWMAAVQTVTASMKAPYRLVVHVAKRTWVRIRMDNGQWYEEKLAAGSVRTWLSNQPFSISMGNAGGVRLELNGRRLPAPDGVMISELVLPQR